jgi:hypothetical protein
MFSPGRRVTALTTRAGKFSVCRLGLEPTGRLRRDAGLPGGRHSVPRRYGRGRHMVPARCRMKTTGGGSYSRHALRTVLSYAFSLESEHRKPQSRDLYLCLVPVTSSAYESKCLSCGEDVCVLRQLALRRFDNVHHGDLTVLSPVGYVYTGPTLCCLDEQRCTLATRTRTHRHCWLVTRERSPGRSQRDAICGYSQPPARSSQNDPLRVGC